MFPSTKNEATKQTKADNTDHDINRNTNRTTIGEKHGTHHPSPHPSITQKKKLQSELLYRTKTAQGDYPLTDLCMAEPRLRKLEVREAKKPPRCFSSSPAMIPNNQQQLPLGNNNEIEESKSPKSESEIGESKSESEWERKSELIERGGEELGLALGGWDGGMERYLDLYILLLFYSKESFIEKEDFY